jgi:hypothetical protein
MRHRRGTGEGAAAGGKLGAVGMSAVVVDTTVPAVTAITGGDTVLPAADLPTTTETVDLAEGSTKWRPTRILGWRQYTQGFYAFFDVKENVGGCWCTRRLFKVTS